MATPTPVVLITATSLLHRGGAHLDLLRQAGFEVRFPVLRGDVLGEADLIEQVGAVHAVLAGTEPYSAAVLQASRLRVIARSGVGYDAIDLAAATRQRIVVTNTPGANDQSVAEHTLALMLNLARAIGARDRSLRRGQWDRRPVQPLRGSTLGIVGLGRIGQGVAQRAHGFGMRIIAHDPVANPPLVRELGIELVDLDRLWAESDVVTLHLPLTAQTRGLICRATLSRMKPTALLINTARGGLIVEADLHEALTTGQIAGAALDVFEREPPGADHPLLALDTVVVSPHLAGVDTRSLADMAEHAARCIVALYRGEWPADSVVNPEIRPGWTWEAEGTTPAGTP